MDKSGMENARLEAELRHGLRRVQAPRELWRQIARPRLDTPPQTRPAKRTLVWTLAATTLALASLVAVAWGYYPQTHVDFRSDQAAAVRNWISTQTGIEVPLTLQPDSRLDMFRVSLRRPGIVEVRYRADGRDASLTVARAGAARPHRELANIHGATTASWTAGQQTFTLSVQHPGDMRAACLVCHLDATI